jgi:quercetin dioxygenase-like cupin family protein
MDYLNKVLNLNTEIAYSPGAIVSKILYKTDHTILTLFALDQDQSIAEHVTPFEAMVSVIDGEAELVIGSETKTVKTGESIIMPAHVPHALFARKGFKMLLTMMK